ncbi:MAG: hypothetical protein UU67_C0055G0002 [Candidatus Daviesbacteria bacterium GW2011_GWB1_41_5]|uniref:Right handed beta helix domain-containing protein n=1 Tax=Candidatus Daviesbacteria bacterium GW2011_GWB1_41_5 TaxID=1618429 RepID=A0A0G0WJQ1_9BACT|nr:MAG: hypothetical protein UU67_C0055G0002 [Candidatus Daviesbacteria bacterium GW2011_GWB1_41_5]
MWIFVAYFVPQILPEAKVSNRQKSGIIFRNESWSGEITITGDIWAMPGTRVNIIPGTKISVRRLGDIFNLDWLPWHLKQGMNTEEEWMGVKNGEFFWDEQNKISLYFAKVYALGMKEQPIIIEAENATEETKVEFNVISIKEGIVSFGKLSNYRKMSLGNKVTVRDSRLSNTGECSLCADRTSPTIYNNIFESAVRAYITVDGGSPKISNNLFTVSKGKGVIVDPERFGAPLIYYNNFEMPGSVALEFTGGGEEIGGTVILNSFSGGSIIEIPCDSKVQIAQNSIVGVLRFAHSGNCVGSLILGANFWQTTDKEAIFREKIVDKEKRFEVLIPAILSTPPADIGRLKE